MPCFSVTSSRILCRYRVHADVIKCNGREITHKVRGSIYNNTTAFISRGRSQIESAVEFCNMEDEIVREDTVPQQYVKLPEFTSKNVFSERKRREKFNTLLCNLRILVPKISKMDKASVLADAIDHVQELRKKVDTTQAEIQSLLHSRESADQPDVEERNGLIVKSSLGRHEHLLELDAQIVEASGIIDLRIQCKEGARILSQLTRAAETLPFPLRNASYNVVGEDLVVNIVLQAESSTDRVDVRQTIVDAFSKQGFSSVLAGDQLPSHSHEL